MVDINLKYEGGLRCSAEHAPSASRLITDAPVDNHGQGEAFSPTDLLATALGSCMLTMMGIVANKHGWNVDGMELHVAKHMTASPPRRVARLAVRFTIPRTVATALDGEARQKLEHTANTCPVRLSLLDAIDVPTEFGW